jgi:hypothetical protein
MMKKEDWEGVFSMLKEAGSSGNGIPGFRKYLTQDSIT